MLNPDYDYWNKKVKSATQEALDSAPKAGTAIHQVLEDCLFNPVEKLKVSEIEALIVDNCESAIPNVNDYSTLTCEEYFVNKEHGLYFLSYNYKFPSETTR